MEDHPAMLERDDRRRPPPLEVEKVSILDPTPLPEEPDPLLTARIVVAAIIVVLVCTVVFLLK
jgi:hypothetical protein